jgi:hypothetical protein
MKKSVFVGASNTFGIGLWFEREIYKNFENVDTRWPYQQSLADDKFSEENRFSKKISNYLNTEEINYAHAGGSPAESLNILQNTDLTDVEYVFFEFSCLFSFYDRYFHQSHLNTPRTPTEIYNFLNNHKKTNENKILVEKIEKWIENYNPQEFTTEALNCIKEFIENNKQIKFIIFIWRDYPDALRLHDEHKWLLDFTPNFPIENDVKNIFPQKFLDYKKLRVCDKFKFIDKMQFPKGHTDLHPNSEGHQQIFEILKDYINEKNSTNSW